MIKEATWFAIVFVVIVTSCADNDSPLKEPVVSADDTSFYSDDPAMVDSTAEEAENESDVLDGIDSLAADPFGPGAPPIDSTDDELISDSTPKDTEELFTGDDYLGDALTDNHESDVPIIRAFPIKKAAPTKKSLKKSKKQKVAAVQKPKTTKGPYYYVKPMLLNVRGSPSLKAPIVRRLLGGAIVQIYSRAPRGFVAIKEGQFIRVKHLSKKPTKRVSRTDVARAWKKSKYKDNWKP